MAHSTVDLVAMDEAEFQAYLAWSIADYAQENMRTGRWSPEEGLQQAEQQYRELLPDGLTSPDQYLFSIQDTVSGQKVGMLWFAVQTRGGKAGAFVYDVKIEEPFRRHGYGEQAFLALEENVRALGLDTIGLHVFGHNHAARALYEKLGYVPTNITMSKTLTS
jgi:RimJ/RimL family protein N-acetyltransferase